ncbi:TetR/AcrR family transcriptional regulator [Clostridium sp. 'White wine YQ']|uniref:TetR/AcrR family transcriptional regulator n=1 Tax=Clostridium sp. 'White wine YQ' TaxID=3027474 RepID=UPI0023668E0B|nr:TetR/AcrR family transcriptional regulator [Clostridium sp. 'White wine YQ']MDD7794332.1 TetR/AcrR family transcriptional regulator [Clostridium sp. 'White wine YQ']
MAGTQRQDQKLKTRNHIIEVALNQFAKDGLTLARTSDIAKVAEVSHGTIFSHFPTRDNLLEEVIEEFGRRITTRLHELVSSDCEMREVLEAHLRGISEYEDFYTRLILESRLLNESSRNSVVMIQSAISFHIIQVAEKDIKECKIREIPLDLIFNTWIGLVHHYLINSDLFTKEGTLFDAHGKRLIDHFINLINK